jgi:hypothetical protein
MPGDVVIFDNTPEPLPSVRAMDDDATKNPSWLARYVVLRFALVFWLLVADPANDWKGPRDNGWPNTVFHPDSYREGMQVGVKTGVEITPGRFL